MRKKLAAYLRLAAYFIDGVEFINARWHRISVDSMNGYIGRTERYILDLEKALGPERTKAIRKRHPGRFDTQPCLDAGAWN